MSAGSVFAQREDTWDPKRRGEDTSKIETRWAKENADEVGTGQEWLAATADGNVKVMPGEPNAAALDRGTPGETELDRLRRLRMAQMKQRAAERQQWLKKGHGQYAELASEAVFLAVIPDHPRVVCHLTTSSLDCELLHRHMRALCKIHLETYFCWLNAECAPMMLKMVKLSQLPALLLCRDGKVVEQLGSIDRSFTTEGVAYELSQHQLLFFEEGVNYTQSAGGATTATANRTQRLPDSDDDWESGDDA
eukprot:CAMPEP_0119308570 /NCGR_PEP_ID=MMETSP1333-20130426/11538_1 /TAXON_ID=418940 /ORGANISM="Scyphosphaera apsteinii, Strain RCC1455" /LENGTH=249 /DNA_ID=CAMNT_0007312377 /DNA_START=20 /DNA_END=769 /DNA_ORIENTATION=-